MKYSIFIAIFATIQLINGSQSRKIDEVLQAKKLEVTKSNCDGVNCPLLNCMEGEIQVLNFGLCCPYCDRIENEMKCDAGVCSSPKCPDGFVTVYDRKEACCPYCDKIENHTKCNIIQCTPPKCEDGYDLVTDQNSCCPYCVQSCNEIICGTPPKCKDWDNLVYDRRTQCCPYCNE